MAEDTGYSNMSVGSSNSAKRSKKRGGMALGLNSKASTNEKSSMFSGLGGMFSSSQSSSYQPPKQEKPQSNGILSSLFGKAQSAESKH